MGEKKDSLQSDEALKAKLAQLELENRLRLQRQASVGQEPFKDTPRRGFGSAQGIAHLRHQEYLRRGPAPAKPAPIIPEPGKARFGGTFLRTPLPGVITPNSEPGGELIPPTPASSSASPRSSAKMAPLNHKVAAKEENTSKQTTVDPAPSLELTVDPGIKRTQAEKNIAPPPAEEAKKNTRLKRFKNPTLNKS